MQSSKDIAVGISRIAAPQIMVAVAEEVARAYPDSFLGAFSAVANGAASALDRDIEGIFLHTSPHYKSGSPCGENIQAITYYRKITGSSLAVAKSFVDAIEGRLIAEGKYRRG